VWEGVVNRGRGLFDGRLVMSSKRVFEVVLEGTLNSGTSQLLNNLSRVQVSTSLFQRWVSIEELVDLVALWGEGD